MPLPAPTLDERIHAMIQLLSSSNRAVMRAFESGQRKNLTRFVAYGPSQVSRLVTKALNWLDPERAISLDLGCGNGGWALMAATAGVPSFGIDISSFLIAHAERNHKQACELGYISRATPCRFAVGNMFPSCFLSRLRALPPQRDEESDAYRSLDLTIGDAGLIYAYAWHADMPCLCQFLSETVRRDTVLVLPLYGSKGFGSQLRLELLDSSERHFCIGRKV